MSMWGEEKIQNDKVRNHKEGESMENDWKDKQKDIRRESEDQDGLKENGNQDVDNGTSAWTATEKDD